jgi:hypothetical protein
MSQHASDPSRAYAAGLRSSGMTGAIAWMGLLVVLGGCCVSGFGLAGGPALFDPAATAHEHAAARGVFTPAGVFLVVFGLAIAGIGWSAKRAGHASLPTGAAAADPVAWALHTLVQRGCFWRAQVGGRLLSARAYYRRHAESGQQMALAMQVPTRLAWTRRPSIGRAIDDLAGQQTQDGAPYGYRDLEVSMAEPDWGLRLIARPDVQGAVAALTQGQGVVMLILRPGKLLFSLPQGSGTPTDHAHVSQWMNALYALARAIEENGPPAQPLERSGIERTADALEG